MKNENMPHNEAAGRQNGVPTAITAGELRLIEACRIYDALKRMTDSGYDVEVKKVSGKIRLVCIKRKTDSEYIME